MSRLEIKNNLPKIKIGGISYYLHHHTNSDIVFLVDPSTLEITEVTLTEKLEDLENDISGKAPAVHDHDTSYVKKNSNITAGTKTKITYDAKGLVTAGANLTKADIPAILALSGNTADNGQYISAVAIDGTDKHKLNFTKASLPTKLGDFTNDTNFQTGTQVASSISTHNNSGSAHSDIRALAQTATDIANGKNRSYVFPTEANLNGWLATPATYTRPDGKTKADLKIGDNLYIIEVDKPDYWWDGNAKQILETQKVDLTGYYTKTQVDTLLSNKVSVVSGKGLSTNDYTTDEKNKLAGIASGAEVNVQSDWNVTNTGSDAYIQNKPTKMEADGGNADTVGGKTVLTDVPANAKFTDTVYTHPTTNGNRHIPANGSLNQVLKNTGTPGSATWQTLAVINTDGAVAYDPEESESVLSGTINLHKVSKTGNYADLRNLPAIPSVGLLKTDSGVSQNVSGGESFSNTINLHKISKTGKYADLVGSGHAIVATTQNVPFTVIDSNSFSLSEGGITNIFMNENADTPKERMKIGAHYLLLNQTISSQNGLYARTGSSGNDYVFTRVTNQNSVVIGYGKNKGRVFSQNYSGNWSPSPNFSVTNVDTSATDPLYDNDLVFVVG